MLDESFAVALGVTVASPTDLFTVFKAPLAFLFPLLILIVSIVLVLRARKNAAVDDRSVVAEYEPPEGLTPAEVGALHDFALDDDRLAFAELAWLVTAGHIEMSGTGKRAVFREGPSYDPSAFELKDHQHAIMKALFEEKSERSYGEAIPLLREAFQGQVLARLKTRGYLRMDPRQARQASRDTFIGMLFVGFGGIGWLVSFVWIFFRVQMRTRVSGAYVLYAAIYLSAIQKFLNIGLLSLNYPENTIFSGGFLFPSMPEMFIAVIVAVAFALLPHRTPKGARVKRKIAGFEDYLKTAEQQRVEYAEEKEGKIVDFSPYALAFGLPSKWNKAFALKG